MGICLGEIDLRTRSGEGTDMKTCLEYAESLRDILAELEARSHHRT